MSNLYINNGIAVFIVLLAVFALPIVGLIMLLNSKTEENKTLGGVLLAVGIVIWIVLGVVSN